MRKIAFLLFGVLLGQLADASHVECHNKSPNGLPYWVVFNSQFNLASLFYQTQTGFKWVTRLSCQKSMSLDQRILGCPSHRFIERGGKDGFAVSISDNLPEISAGFFINPYKKTNESTPSEADPIFANLSLFGPNTQINYADMICEKASE